MLALVSVLVLGARARADGEICPAEIRHNAGPASEGPGFYSVALVAKSPRSVVAEWAAYTDHGFLRAQLPELQLTNPDGSAKASNYGARSRTVAIAVPTGTKILESWIRNARVTQGEQDWIDAGVIPCFPPQGDPTKPVHRRVFPGDPPDPIPTQMPLADPAIAPLLAVAAPNLERLDCPHPFFDARAIKPTPPQRPDVAYGNLTAVVVLTIDPAGKLIYSEIRRSSGQQSVDWQTLSAARQTTYRPAYAFCRPVYGRYSWRADFVQ